MITKIEIAREKLNPNSPFFSVVLAPTNEEQQLLFTLKNLGKLPDGFDGELFVPLLEHRNPKIRCLAVKNVGKLKDISFLTKLVAFAKGEKNTIARREAVSAIGRLKTENAISILTQFTTDADPKIILQALRGLLYFREHPDVKTVLTSLAEHPNEMIREQITKELKVRGQTEPPKTRNHPASPEALKNVMVRADVQDVLKVIPDESVHLTFTSPPYYNARDYTIFPSYEAYLDFLTAVFRETHRITKEGRFFVLNTSPVIVPRISRAHSSKRYAIPYDIHPRLTEIGWEFIDDIVWVKPDYAAKNRNGGFFQHRKPLGYKANSVTESVMVYRKKTDKLIDWNLRQYDDDTIDASKVMGEYEKTNVWQINPATDKVHPAIFPPELAARVIKFYSFKGDLVFDPFGGSGTVGYVALAHERNYILCEKEAEYIERAEQMLDTSLFSAANPRILSLTELKSDIAAETQEL
ncbi:MAG: DNA methyltransferase [Candidatus Poribacteria bacterium]|nr:DNA methyltransferase [Candidatus Poribacteria bacterium]